VALMPVAVDSVITVEVELFGTGAADVIGKQPCPELVQGEVPCKVKFKFPHVRVPVQVQAPAGTTTVSPVVAALTVVCTSEREQDGALRMVAERLIEKRIVAKSRSRFILVSCPRCHGIDRCTAKRVRNCDRRSRT
jgi:hypothetical protein